MMSKYKSIFISDIHLGSRGSKAKLLYEFLDYIEDDVGTHNLFIVGDLIDIWALKRKWKFPKSHSNIVRKLLGMAKRGIDIEENDMSREQMASITKGPTVPQILINDSPIGGFQDLVQLFNTESFK